jgi:thiosulfate/3-mercaptopyruvate sulfurtransferase
VSLPQFGPLVGPEELAPHLEAPDLNGPGLVVLDATFYLPTEGKDAAALYAGAHIPGARFFDIDAVSDQRSNLPHMLPGAEGFAAAADALGIGDDTHVVVYDQKGVFSAPRVWWMFRVFGHDAVSVLDGGLPEWQRLGHAVSAAPVAPPTPPAVRFKPRFRSAMVRGFEAMLANLTGQAALVLDARPAPRFRGEVAEPRPGLRSGHIPGARSIPYTNLLAGGRYLPPEKLRAGFAAAGVDGGKPVVTSCGSGVSAAVLTLGMMLAGLPEGALYDGSWAEWGGRAEAPVEKGA